jgi:hypothetical protein
MSHAVITWTLPPLKPRNPLGIKIDEVEGWQLKSLKRRIASKNTHMRAFIKNSAPPNLLTAFKKCSIVK